jgi:hypothetical protein
MRVAYAAHYFPMKRPSAPHALRVKVRRPVAEFHPLARQHRISAWEMTDWV